MSERSVAEVRARLAQERRDRDRIIAKQSFRCKRQNRFMGPAECHDCFASLPYLERLTRWNEDRARCIREHAEDPLIKDPDAEKGCALKTQAPQTDASPRSRTVGPAFEAYSIEEYMSMGLLEFLLELEELTERFETWWVDLADAARERLHASEELGELLLWFAGRLAEFEKTLVLLGRSPEELPGTIKNKEESCGVKNSQ